MPAHTKPANINLVIKDDLGDTLSGQLLTWALTYGRYIIIMTQIVVLSVFFLRFKLDRDHNDLKEAVAQKQALIQSVSDLEKEVRYVQGKIVLIKTTIQNQDIPVRILKFLSENSPSDVSLASLNISDNKISFSATAKSLRSFSALTYYLQKDNKLDEVTLEDIVRKVDGSVEFNMNALVNPKEFSSKQP